jgi:hypothetical protein
MPPDPTDRSRKQVFEMPVVLALLGAIVGGIIGFASSWFLTQTQLQHSDHQDLVAARRVAYEAFVRDLKTLSLTTADLQSAVSTDPQGSDAVHASTAMAEESTNLVTDYTSVQIDGSAAAESRANSDFAIIHQALVDLNAAQTDPAAYRRVENALDQAIKAFVQLARTELGASPT